MSSLEVVINLCLICGKVCGGKQPLHLPNDLILTAAFRGRPCICVQCSYTSCCRSQWVAWQSLHTDHGHDFITSHFEYFMFYLNDIFNMPDNSLLNGTFQQYVLSLAFLNAIFKVFVSLKKIVLTFLFNFYFYFFVNIQFYFPDSKRKHCLLKLCMTRWTQRIVAWSQFYEVLNVILIALEVLDYGFYLTR